MNKHINRAATLYLILLSVLSQAYLMNETLGCKVSWSFPLWVILLILLTWFSACFRRGIFIGMPLAGLVLYLAYHSLGANPSAQLNDLFDRITGVYYEHFYAPGASYSFLNSVPDHTLVMIFLAFLLAAYMSSALTTRSGRLVMSFMGTVPFFAACLASNGKPSVTPVVAMMLFWILLLVSGGSYEENSSDGKAVFLLSIPVAILLCLVLWFCHPERYEINEEDITASQRFDRLTQLLSDLFGGESSRVEYTGPAEGQLQQVTPIPTEKPENQSAPWHNERGELDLTLPYDPDLVEKELLKIRSDSRGTLYLRTISYGDYLGTGWAADAENAPVSSLPFAARIISRQSVPHRLSVTPYIDLDYQCVPYYSTASGGKDSYVPSGWRSSYTLEYYRLSNPLPDQSQSPGDEQEASYAAYAHRTYTLLPGDTRAAIQRLCESLGFSPDSPNLIQEVAGYIQSAGTYDLETGAYPSSDYAVYFLTEARHGYCIHFATAAAVMYRSLGIPARVTEGFLVDVEADQEYTVLGANAHAWVEVYQEGLGWIPVEVTGRSGLGQTEIPDTEPSEVPQGSDGDVQEEPAPTQPEAGEEGAEGAQELPVGVIENQEQEYLQTPKNRRRIQVLLRCLPILAILFGAIPLWRLLVRLWIRAQLNQKDGKRSAIALWRYAQKVSSFGVELPFALRNTAEKASFSTHSISKEELLQSRQLLSEMINEVYPALKPWKKLQFKYFYGLK